MTKYQIVMTTLLIIMIILYIDTFVRVHRLFNDHYVSNMRLLSIINSKKPQVYVWNTEDSITGMAFVLPDDAAFFCLTDEDTKVKYMAALIVYMTEDLGMICYKERLAMVLFKESLTDMRYKELKVILDKENRI